MKSLRVFPTKIEIFPYKYGDYTDLERMCSTDYDPVTHSVLPIGYRIEGNSIYIPRGLNLQYLSNKTGSVPTMYRGTEWLPMKKEYKMKIAPRNDEQKQAIMFLLGEGNYYNTKRYPQLALVVQPGFGKTYCAVFAMIAMKRKTIIILHRDTIREQWIETLREKTTMNMDRVCQISGSEFMTSLSEPKNINKYDVYLVLHQTLGSFMKNNGFGDLKEWFESMKFGLKITDEVHYCFEQTVETDFCANVSKNFYLSATFTRSDRKEVKLFNRVFANTMKYGTDLDIVKNVIYNIIFFNSNPSVSDQASIKTYYGVSSTRYADYAFSRDEYATIYSVFFRILEKALLNEGKIIVVIPKIDYCEKISELIKREHPHINVGTMHSRNTKKQNEYVKEHSEIIVSTISSLGTGADIDKVRSLIIMEPYSSKVTAKQLTGRLRPYGNEDSYVYELLDIGFELLTNMLAKREGVLKSICKEVKKFKI